MEETGREYFTLKKFKFYQRQNVYKIVFKFCQTSTVDKFQQDYGRNFNFGFWHKNFTINVCQIYSHYFQGDCG